MPKERFYRLSEDKQRKIYKAARMEFARVPYEQASINQIIKKADISRGSFYTYFYDKYDAMEYVLAENFQEIRHVCEEALESNHGEYLSMIQALFRYMYETLPDTRESINIVKNIFCQRDDIFLFGYQDEFLKLPGTRHLDIRDWIIEKVNREQLCDQTEETFQAFLSLGINVLFWAVQQYCQHPEQIKDIKRLFDTKLQMIRMGAYQMKEAC